MSRSHNSRSRHLPAASIRRGPALSLRRSWHFPDGEPVRDWRALLITWASRDREDEKPEPEKPKEAPHEKACPGCGSGNIKQKGNELICNACGKGYAWTGKTWREG